MASLVTLLLWMLPIAAVFGIVYSDKRIYDVVEVILTRVFENSISHEHAISHYNNIPGSSGIGGAGRHPERIYYGQRQKASDT